MTIPKRIVQVLVGPAGGVGFNFTEEDMEFSVKGYRGSKPNECTVKISNLSSQKIAFLEKKNLVLQLSAGENTPGILFRGSIQPRGVVTKNAQPERETEIKCVDGRRQWRDAKTAASYPNNTTVAAVVQDILAQSTARGFAIAPGNTYPTGSFPQGYYHAGRWRDALTEILYPRNFWWTIQDRTIYVGPQDGLNAGNVPLLTPQTGLIGSPQKTQKGINFDAVLDPRIRPGWGVQVKSEFVSGTYRVVVREHHGDSRGRKWMTRVQCENIK
ncbi:MAG: hypothetical protein PVJ86_11755 [Phycisphaerales bacterium]|jgi:hypothetical protein